MRFGVFSNAERFRENQQNPNGRQYQQAGRRVKTRSAGKAYDSRMMLRLARYLAPYKLQASVSVVAVILKAACDVVGPYLVKVGLDRYLTSHATLNTAAPSNWLARPSERRSVHRPWSVDDAVSLRVAVGLAGLNSHRPT